jgi:hypothetical protein
MSLLRSVAVVIVEEPQRLYRVNWGQDDDGFAAAIQSRERQLASTLHGAA